MEDKIKDILASNKFNDLYDNFIELQKDCDVSFNIFTMISDKYHLENMHTDIIKCFLDPKEGHNEGYKFLFLFIDMINAIGKEGININKDLYVNAKVESQYPVDCNSLLQYSTNICLAKQYIQPSFITSSFSHISGDPHFFYL